MYLRGSTPVSVPGLFVWLDSLVPSSIISSGGAISQWSDVSGRGNHFTQSTGANKPALSGSLISFNGTSSYLQNSSIINKLSHANSNFSVYAAFNTSNYTINNQNILGNAISGNNDEWLIQILFNELTGAGWRATLDNADSVSFTSNAINSVTLLNLAVSFNVDTYLNYTIMPGTNPPAVATTGSVCTIGCTPALNYFFSGNMREVLMYERYVSGAENTLIQQYLSNKWGSPAS